MTNLLKQLEDTRDVLVTRGRGTGRLFYRDSCLVCLLGAVTLAVLGEGAEDAPEAELYRRFEDRDPRLQPIVDALVAELPDYSRPDPGASYPFNSLWKFNDGVDIHDDGPVFDLINKAIHTEKDRIGS